MIEIKNISKVYKPKKGVPVVALNELSLKFEDTGMVFILGKSGSGKSTLLNVLGGLDKYDKGEFIIKGKSSKNFTQSDFDSYRNTFIGFIFQEYNILNEFSVGANIALAIELQGRKATSEEINEILKEVDLEGYGDRKPNELSGGQKQRVAIARALIKKPEIIMADEPTGALDSNTGMQVFNTLKKLSKKKLVIVVSHDREFAEYYGDRVIELADGKVISDISKYIAEPKHESDNIKILDNSLLHINKGYQLTQEDIELINKYIANNSENDIFISLDERTNKQIRITAKIDDTGKKESFKGTDNDNLNLKQYSKDDSKFIRSRLPLKNSLKIASSSLKVKPFRLFLTILLSSIAFALFGLASTISSYDNVTATLQSLHDSNINYIAFSKREYRKYNYDGNEYVNIHEVNLNDDDKTLLEQQLGVSFIPVFKRNKYSMISFDNSIYSGTGMGYDKFYKGSFSGYAELTSADIDALGFTLVGNMPTKNNEIVITDYAYEHFVKGGYRYGNIILENVTNKEQIIGKKIIVSDNDTKEYTVVGIVNTNLDDTRYESLKNPSTEGSFGFGDYFMQLELNTVINFSYHALLIVNEGFSEQNLISFGMSTNDANMYWMLEDLNSSYYPNNLAKYSEITDMEKVHFFDNNKTTLSNNEILFSTEMFLNNAYIESELYQGYLNGLVQSYVQQMAFLWCEENLAQAVENGFIVNNEENALYEYYEYMLGIYYSISDHGFYSNEYGDKSGRDIEIEATLELLEIIKDDINYDMTLNYTNYNNYKDGYIDLILAGLYIDYNSSLQYGGDAYIIFSDSRYEAFEFPVSGPYSLLLAGLPEGNAALRKIIAFSYDDGLDDVDYVLNNSVSILMYQVDSYLGILASVFLYVGIGFAVFSSIMLSNFIAVSIANKKREIGILRAVGAKSSDVFGIFFNESLMIALINFTVATAITVGGIMFINNLLRTQYNILITFLNFGIVPLSLMIGISVGVAFIASFLPVYKIAKKRPIDAINNR